METAPRPRRWVWLALAVAASLVPVRGVFTLSSVFYVRDLSFYFWPAHQWLRRTIGNGHAPLWDPYLAYGQSAIADPVRQLLFLPTLPFRLLLPEIPAFNLWVALPFPCLATGAYLFLRRHTTAPAAAMGAIVAAVSGPVLSTGNFLNISWSIACVFWALWGVDRLASEASASRGAALALVFALQLLAGEPVTLVVTAALALGYATVASSAGTRPRRARLFARVAVAGLAGLLLAAAQALPLVDAARQTARGVRLDRMNLWSLHPLTLVEAIMPGLYGDVLWSGLDGNPWIAPLNDGMEPYIFSIYLGVGALLLAALGALYAPTRRWAVFWCVVLLVATLCALGHYTPFYPTLQAILPLARSFRSPAKFMVFAPIATAALAASGWDAVEGLAAGRLPRARLRRLVAAAASVALGAGAVWVTALALPAATTSAATALAALAALPDAAVGGSFLSESLLSAAPRLVVVAGGCAGFLLLATSSRREARLARLVLYGLVVFDLLAANAGLNPTMEAALLREPAWVAHTRERADLRVYVAGRLARAVPGTETWTPTRGRSARAIPSAAMSALSNTQFATFPPAFELREAISIDYVALWSRRYSALLRRFGEADPDSRTRFLARTGVGYYLMPWPPSPEARRLTTLTEFSPVALYEGPTPTQRAIVINEAAVEPDPAHQIEHLFGPDTEPAVLLLEAPPPPPAGAAGQPAAAASCRILGEEPTRMTLWAEVPAGGAYLVLRDTYDPDWIVTVDGHPAPLLRADGLFRAVHLADGTHTVRMVYRPRPFLVGGAISLLSTLLLAVVCVGHRRRKRGRYETGDQEIDAKFRRSN